MALGATYPPIQWVLGALSLKVKRPGRESDHLPQSSAEITNAWSYTYTPRIRLRGVVLYLTLCISNEIGKQILNRMVANSP